MSWDNESGQTHHYDDGHGHKEEPEMTIVIDDREDEVFQAPATVSKITTLADNTIRLQLDTQEASAESMMALFSLRGKLGWFVFKETEVQPSDIPDVNIDVEAGQKSHSARIRAKLWHYWNDRTSRNEPFEQYYTRAMDKLERQIDDQLN